METTARLPSIATVQLQTATSVRGGLIVDGHVEVSQEWGRCYMGMIKGSLNMGILIDDYIKECCVKLRCAKLGGATSLTLFRRKKMQYRRSSRGP